MAASRGLSDQKPFIETEAWDQWSILASLTRSSSCCRAHGDRSGCTVEGLPPSQALVPSVHHSASLRMCICLCSPEGPFWHWKYVQQLMSLFSLPDTHCSMSRLKVTPNPQGLRISPVSMRTVLSDVHTQSCAACCLSRSPVSPEFSRDTGCTLQEGIWKCLGEVRQGSRSNSNHK